MGTFGCSDIFGNAGGDALCGVDVGGIAFIHSQILEARAQGKAILLISADLDEILTLADRIAVLFEGRIAGRVDAAQAEPQRLGLWMTGTREPQT